jgi:hypothetical protein
MVASTFPQLSPSSRPHVHLTGEVCPYCEQPIPNEKAEQVRARWEAKKSELSETLTARLTQKFALEKAQLEASADARVDQVRSESTAAFEKMKNEFASREATAREEGKKEGVAMLQQRLTEQERTSQAQIESVKEQLGEAQRARQEATTKVETLMAAQEAEIQQRVQEAREALEAANMKAMNEKDAKHFEEKQKLTSKLAEAMRQVEKQRANELGEGAEIDLFETLKAKFEGDRIYRVKKGEPGADIIHEIIHKDKVCGKIVYDSKNRMRWSKEYVAKLHTDQLAARAEHAILVALKLPPGHSQFCVGDDQVIIANPARVLAVVQLLRRHIVHVHSMRLSNDARAQKTDELYEFIRSERFGQLFERFYSQPENILKLQAEGKRALDKLWEQQGTLLRGIQKAHGELISEIDRIIGTGSDRE